MWRELRICRAFRDNVISWLAPLMYSSSSRECRGERAQVTILFHLLTIPPIIIALLLLTYFARPSRDMLIRYEGTIPKGLVELKEPVETVQVSPDGTLWLVTSNGLLYSLHGMAWKKEAEIASGPLPEGKTFLIASGKSVWFYRFGTLLKIENGNWREIKGVPQEDITSCAADEKNFWTLNRFLTMHSFDGENWSRAKLLEKIPDALCGQPCTPEIALDWNGTLWLSGNGIWRYIDGEWRKTAVARGKVWSIAGVSKDHIWFRKDLALISLSVDGSTVRTFASPNFGVKKTAPRFLGVNRADAVILAGDSLFSVGAQGAERLVVLPLLSHGYSAVRPLGYFDNTTWAFATTSMMSPSVYGLVCLLFAFPLLISFTAILNPRLSRTVRILHDAGLPLGSPAERSEIGSDHSASKVLPAFVSLLILCLFFVNGNFFLSLPDVIKFMPLILFISPLWAVVRVPWIWRKLYRCEYEAAFLRFQVGTLFGLSPTGSLWGNMLNAAGRFDEASAFFSEYVEGIKDPQLKALAAAEYAEALVGLRRLSEAESLAAASLRASTPLSHASYILAVAYLEQSKEPKTVLKLLKHAGQGRNKEFDPEVLNREAVARLLVLRGWALALLDQDDEAMRNILAAFDYLKKNRRSESALVNYFAGRAMQAKGDTLAALDFFNRAHDTDPAGAGGIFAERAIRSSIWQRQRRPLVPKQAREVPNPRHYEQ